MNSTSILITGSNGFIGKNLVSRLEELGSFSIETFTRENSIDDLFQLVKKVDFIVHLAGVNRPNDNSEFNSVNRELTEIICDAIYSAKKNTPLLFISSIQAEYQNPYGKSKLAAELLVKKLADEVGNSVFIYRLPGVFGKWCKPNYNSVVATFCHNISHDLPIEVDPSAELTLVYIDDVVFELLDVIQNNKTIKDTYLVQPEYKITVKKLAEQIYKFRDSRNNLYLEEVGSGLTRALYSTYVSYLDPEQFSYSVSFNEDERGIFCELFKTKTNGQFSFFTAHPGITRGGHYHHSKTEKFVIIKGKALFRFRNIDNNITYEIVVSCSELRVVDTVPGWTHDITNIGDDELIVMIWANEIFDKQHPDTTLSEV